MIMTTYLLRMSESKPPSTKSVWYETNIVIFSINKQHMHELPLTGWNIIIFNINKQHQQQHNYLHPENE